MLALNSFQNAVDVESPSSIFGLALEVVDNSEFTRRFRFGDVDTPWVPLVENCPCDMLEALVRLAVHPLSRSRWSKAKMGRATRQRGPSY